MLNVLVRNNFRIRPALFAGLLAASVGIPGSAFALTCTDCHGNPPVDNASRVGGKVGQFPGSHGTHSGTGTGQYGYACTKCHVNNTAANHANGNIDMAVPINGNAGGAYGKGTSFQVSNDPLVGKSCSATYCHSKGTSVATGTIPASASPAWGDATACNSCHGTESGTSGAPGYVTIRSNPTAAPTGTGWTNPTNALVEDGSYAVYNTTTAQPLVLTTFNMTGAGLTAGDTVTGITVYLHGLATSGLVNVALTKTGNTTVAGTAKTVAMPVADNWVAVNTTPTDLWGTTWSAAELQAANFGVIVKDNDATASNIQIDCVRVVVHTASAPKMNSHASHSSKGCQVCHNATTTTGTSITGPGSHVTGSYSLSPQSGTAFSYTYSATGGSCSSVSCHSTAVWGVSKLGCVGCHSVSITRSMGRPGSTLAAVSKEFGLAWGHKKSGRGGVTDADCIVCHLEGNYGTGKTSAYHQDGNIDLRNPDGAGETPITNISGAAFVFQRFSTSYVAGSRTSTGHTLNTVDNVVTQKFCLACHDGDGATNTTARTAGGTQYMPFGGVNLGAAYTVANGAAAAGGLINAKAQFATTNSSRHPVMGPNSRAYPYSTRLASPYNGLGTTRNSNTASGNTASPRVKADSVVMNCFDCHTTGTSVTLRTIVAHGNNATLRGTVFVASPTLCTSCHVGNTTTTNGYLTSNQHGNGSALATGDSHISSYTTTCHNCHFSSYTAPARPVRAFDVHGFNGLLATGGAWTYGNANGMRPVAFLRNVARWSTTSLRPYVAPGITAGQSNCGGSASLGTNCGSENHGSYSPGGSY